MTLHEQYKERISNCKKERNCKDEYCTCCYADEYIKQSFLDSIDCMIAKNKSTKIDGLKEIKFGASVVIDRYDRYLNEQRELIANEK